MAAVGIPGPSPQELWPQERSQGWGNLQRFTDLIMPTSNFPSSSQRCAGQWLTAGSPGAEQCFVASDDFPGVNTPTVTPNVTELRAEESHTVGWCEPI